MKVFVTGGTGFIGSHTCHALVEAGHTVKLFVRNKAKAQALFGNKIKSIVVGDIANASDIKKGMKGCDAVIHMAAMVSTNKDDAEKVYQTNLSAAKNVLGTAVEQGCKKIVHVSSITAIYNSKAKKLDHNSPLGNAKNAYGRSKVDCEAYARELQSQGNPVFITYPASVIGPDDPGLTEPQEGLIMSLFSLAVSMPSGSQFVDVRDVALAHTALIEHDLRPARYPLGGNYITWKQLYATLEHLTGRSFTFLPIPGISMRMLGRMIDALRPMLGINTPISGEAMEYATQWVLLDNTKTEEDLGLNFRPLEETLIDAVRWLERENYITRGQAGELSRHST